MNAELNHSRYQLLEEIGAGGMGEVYKARDLQLDRIVALKAIRPEFGTEPDVVRRLEREARIAASLDHPFICKVYELLRLDDGRAFVVMEYLEGDTLRTVLARGPLDVAHAVRVAGEIAEALGVAHARGLIHRDVKPANIMVTPHGHIKVMDFGIAKAVHGPEETTTTTLTGPGHIVGTPAYMSPEQAAGRVLDQRSDIYSFGLVFYECLTGKRPSEDAPASAIPADLRALVTRCLEPSPAARFGSFAEVRTALDAAALRMLSGTWRPTLAQVVRRSPYVSLWVALTLIGAIAAGTVAVVKFRPASTATPSSLVQEPVVTWPTSESGSRISPDGTTVSFVSAQGGRQQLWLRSLHATPGSEPRHITEPLEAVRTPIWSPDGKQLAYLFKNDGKAWLQQVSVWGETQATAASIGDVWDNVALVRWIGSRIYFSVASLNSSSALWRYDTATRAAQPVTDPVNGKRFVASGGTVSVDVRRDETKIAFTAAGGKTDSLWIADLDGRNAANVAVGGARVITPRWRGPDGASIVYVSNENGQFDVWEYSVASRTRTALTTSPLEEKTVDVAAAGNVLVADTVTEASHLWAVDPHTAAAPQQLTNDGRRDVWTAAASSGRVLFHRSRGSYEAFSPFDTNMLLATWVNHRLEMAGDLGAGFGASLSPTARRAYFLRESAASPVYPELWVKDLNTPRPAAMLWERFLFPGVHIQTWSPMSRNAAWAPNNDGLLYFVRQVAAAKTVEVVRAELRDDLSADMRVLAAMPLADQQRFGDLSVSPDGASLAYVTTGRRPYLGGKLMLTNTAEPKPALLLEAPVGTQLFAAGWSRRGRLVAVISPPQGLSDVVEVDRGGSRRLIARVEELVGPTVVLDALHDRIVFTRTQDGVSSVMLLSLMDGRVTTAVPNALDGVTFGGYAPMTDGWLIYARKETNNDVWAFSEAPPPQAKVPQEPKR